MVTGDAKGRQMARKSYKVTLPGSIYQRNKRWRWRVRLPGENRVKVRALKPKGSRFATGDFEEAQEIALAMWESAIRAEAEARVRAEARRKAKASAEEIAKAKAEVAETAARIKAEVVDMIDSVKAECEEELRLSAESVARAQEKAKVESEKRARIEVKLNEVLSGSVRTAACECCGRQEVTGNELAKIDSGQMLCPDCLKALRG